MEPTEATPSDLDLIRAFAAGGSGAPAALGTLAERYERPMLGLARGLLGGRHDAALDAVQDVWLRVIRHAAKFDGRSSVKTWLYRILMNRCHVLRAASRRERPAADPHGDAAGAHGHPASVAPGASNNVLGAPLEAAPLDTSADDETRAAVARHVAALPEGPRAVLLLCYHAGMSHPQAADILGIPIGTLKSRLHAGLAELRTRLAPHQEKMP